MQAISRGRRFARAASAAIEAAEGGEVAAFRRGILDRWHLAMRQGSAAGNAAEVVGVPRSTLFNWDRLQRQGRLEPRFRRPRLLLRKAWSAALVKAVREARSAPHATRFFTRWPTPSTCSSAENEMRFGIGCAAHLSTGTQRSAYLNKQAMQGFPHVIQDFADTFVVMQEARHQADYSYEATYYREDTLAKIDRAADAIGQLKEASIEHRHGLVAHLLLKRRP